MSRIGKALLLFVVTEICMGGGGRFTAWGPVSLRMILFGGAIVYTLLSLWQGQRIKKEYIQLTFIFAFTLVVGLVIGFVNQAPVSKMWEDVKPLMYFMMLPFFALTIQTKEDVEKCASIIRWSAVAMAAIFFTILLVIHFHFVPFLTFYNSTINTEELFFRGEYTFFYKGFLFLSIGVLFFAFSKDRYKNVFITILVIALLLSFTRGFLLALTLTLFLFYISQKKIIPAVIFFLISFFILAYGGTSISALSRWMANQNLAVGNSASRPERAATLLGDRLYSDDQRKLQIQEVYERISFSSLLVGHGFGIGIPAKPIHMEIAYLEILHKQGLIGLLFWGIFGWKIYRSYRSGSKTFLSNAFFFSSVFVAIESLTNQYINNPIGMTVLLISWISLNQLRTNE